jgi:hypothetical protein
LVGGNSEIFWEILYRKTELIIILKISEID